MRRNGANIYSSLYRNSIGSLVPVKSSYVLNSCSYAGFSERYYHSSKLINYKEEKYWFTHAPKMTRDENGLLMEREIPDIPGNPIYEMMRGYPRVEGEPGRLDIDPYPDANLQEMMMDMWEKGTGYPYDEPDPVVPPGKEYNFEDYTIAPKNNLQ